ncbi:LysE family translocator [Paenibacillus brasilensis]|uniref:Threonine/homoserine/homoserine lactone efflux protein n=1 Tax=Paenibacillus brasilensis TaxID=128574 RepID=A0ABU0KXY7_9BACL|nr:LysE family transporter [Paenibacillus brasilensis]MDQ0492822.1 threonine/homoserine/homoserine lactone efflux protein [Paenibacillus brasilensis]
MSWKWMVKGILLGLSIAAPLGPVSILCVKKTMISGFKTGLLSGLGAATADAVYGSIAGLGLSALTNFLIEYKTVLQAIAGLFICFLGIKSLLHTPTTERSEPHSRECSLNSYAGTLLLTLSNPMTIVFFLGVFGASGILLSHTSSDIPFLIVGVFLGSALWWVCLTGTASLFRINMTVERSKLSLFNKLSGMVMLYFGLIALIQSLGLLNSLPFSLGFINYLE